MKKISIFHYHGKSLSAITLITVVAIVLSGCTTLGPDFDTPAATVSDQWLEDKTEAVSSASSDITLQRWWEIFNDPSLNQLIDTAIKRNLSLQIAGLRVMEARAQLGIAGGNLYPQLQQARAGGTYSSLSENTANSAGIDRNFWDYGAGFDVAWEIDFWGKFRRAIQSADAQLLADMASYDDFMISLISEVASTYVLIRTFENRIELARQNVELQQRGLQITDVRFNNGATTELDVQQAKTLLRNTQATIPVLMNGYRQALHALSILLGTPPSELDDYIATAGPIPLAPMEVTVGIPADLLRRRPDIRRAEMEAVAQSALIGVAKSELYPSFSLFGSLGLRSSDGTSRTASGDSGIDELFQSNSLEFIAGPSFTWNIFNYGRIKNLIRVQDARFQQLVINYQNTVLRAAREVEDGISGFVNSVSSEKYLRDSVEAALRSVDLAMLQYRDGVTNYQRVIDTQTALVDQQDLWTQTRGAIASNLIATYRALGGGWDINTKYVTEDTQKIMQQRTDWGRLLDQ